MWISEVDKTKISVGDGKRSTKSKGGSSHDTELDSDDLMSIHYDGISNMLIESQNRGFASISPHSRCSQRHFFTF